MVFPRLIAAEHRGSGRARPSWHPSVAELDELLGGGIEEGTSTLVVGGAGTGKSTIAAQFCVAAAQRGQKSIIFMFDESPNTLFSRCDGARHRHSSSRSRPALIEIVQIDPAELSPGEFTHLIREAVEQSRRSRSSWSTASTAT